MRCLGILCIDVGFVTITVRPFRHSALKVLVKHMRNFGPNLTKQTKWLDNRIKASLQNSIVANFTAPAESLFKYNRDVSHF